MVNSKIMVSIICNVYNHEPYIREALDSFLMQKTSFAYEILIHDDASTDSSADVIREYENKYPSIVKPIYQTINQYKRCNITLTYQIPRVKGKYVAICEGDDYWDDSYKLQKQFEAMESHPEIDMCAHSANVISGNKVVAKIAPRSIKTIIDTNHVILGMGGFFSTNSLFFRIEMFENTPDFYSFFAIDYMLQIWGSLRGGVLYLPDYMSTYRTGVSNSWSDRMRKNTVFNIEQKEKIVKALHLVDLYTSMKYHNAISQIVAEYSIVILMIQHRYYEIRHGEYAQYYNGFSKKEENSIIG